MHRCVICNAVSELSLSNSTSEYKPKAWHDTDDGYLCNDCNNEVEEAIGEFNIEEELKDIDREFWDSVAFEILEEGLKK